MNPPSTRPTVNPPAASPSSRPDARVRPAAPSAQPAAPIPRRPPTAAPRTAPAPETSATPTPPTADPGGVTGKPPAGAAAKTTAAPGAAGGARAARTKKLIVAGVGAAAVLTLGVFIYARFLRPVDPPRLNSEPYVIGKFTATRDFDRLDFAKKWQYYELLDDKEDALKAAYAAGQMNDDEYRTARQAAWYGKHLGRMRNYFEKAPGREREAYLDKQVLKKYGDGKGGSKSAAEPDTRAPLTADEIKRDDSDEEGDVSAWPADVRSKWDEYRTAYRARKDIYKQARDAEKARKNAPVTAPVRVGPG